MPALGLFGRRGFDRRLHRGARLPGDLAAAARGVGVGVDRRLVVGDGTFRRRDPGRRATPRRSRLAVRCRAPVVARWRQETTSVQTFSGGVPAHGHHEGDPVVGVEGRPVRRDRQPPAVRMPGPRSRLGRLQSGWKAIGAASGAASGSSRRLALAAGRPVGGPSGSRGARPPGPQRRAAPDRPVLALTQVAGGSAIGAAVSSAPCSRSTCPDRRRGRGSPRPAPRWVPRRPPCRSPGSPSAVAGAWRSPPAGSSPRPVHPWRCWPQSSLVLAPDRRDGAAGSRQRVEPAGPLRRHRPRRSSAGPVPSGSWCGRRRSARWRAEPHPARRRAGRRGRRPGPGRGPCS